MDHPKPTTPREALAWLFADGFTPGRDDLALADDALADLHHLGWTLVPVER